MCDSIYTLFRPCDVEVLLWIAACHVYLGVWTGVAERAVVLEGDFRQIWQHYNLSPLPAHISLAVLLSAVPPPHAPLANPQSDYISGDTNRQKHTTQVHGVNHTGSHKQNPT